MLDQLLTWVVVVFAVAVAGATLLGWWARDKVKARKCRRGQHEWSQSPIRGVGEIGSIVYCRQCGAEYTRHRGF